MTGEPLTNPPLDVEDVGAIGADRVDNPPADAEIPEIDPPAVGTAPGHADITNPPMDGDTAAGTEDEGSENPPP